MAVRTPPMFRQPWRLPWPIFVAGVLGLVGWATTGRPDPLAGTRMAPRVELGAPLTTEIPGTPVPGLRLPFPAGTVVLCSQGNDSGEGRTHSLPQNLHALDFSNRVVTDLVVVAAARGTVAYVVDNAGDDPRAGGGYGNQVRVLHEQGVFSEYAHLDRVDVSVGDRIVSGQRLGTAGKTGLAGDRHLHFSVHHGTIDAVGVPPTLPIPALVTWEIGDRAGFAARPSATLHCSRTGRPWGGRLYASENRPGRATRGFPSAPLAERLAMAASELRAAVDRRDQLWHFSTEIPRTTPAVARQFLEPWLQADPGDPVTRYAWAVEVEMPSHDWRAAEAHLDAADQGTRQLRYFEPWLPAWIENQRGAIALATRRPDEAEDHFDRAAELLPMPEVIAFAERHRESAPSLPRAFPPLQ